MAPQDISRLQNCLTSLKREKLLMEAEFERRKQNIRNQLLLATTPDRTSQLFRDLASVNDERLLELAKIDSKIRDIQRNLFI